MAWQNMLQLLLVSVLCFLLFLPSLRCDNLLCYFSPILEKEKTVELTVTECPPKEQCFEAVGRYGNYTALSARGCLPKERCGQQVNIRLKGTVYIMSYSCCDWPYCNSSPAVKPLHVSVTLLAFAVVVCSL